jgi:tripartite-type tricarboxylate transporter receptor subunit TctC
MCVVAFNVAPAAYAQPAALEFYKGRTLTIVTSTGPGGGYDLAARLIARFMPRYLPGIGSIVVQNMPGAGNLRATNYMYEIAPKDGTMIGVVENAIPLKQVLGDPNVRFDISKFNWIGSTGGHNEVIMVMSSSGITSIEDLKTKEVVLGGTGPGSSIVIYPTAMNNVLGTKFKIVTGYTSSTEIYLAMDRGEVLARSGTVPSLYNWHPDYVAAGKIKILAQVGLKPDAQLPGIPLLVDLAQTEEDRRVLALVSSPGALGQPYYTPPGVPADRVALLRTAIYATMKDPDFLAEAAKAQADINAMSGEELTRIIDSIAAAPAPVVERTRQVIDLK